MKISHLLSKTLLLSCLVSLVITVQAAGQQIPWNYWYKPVDGVFQNPSGWYNSHIPTATEGAQFGYLADYTIDFTDNVTNRALWVGMGSITFDLQGHTYQLTEPTLNYYPSIYVASYMGLPNSLTIENGTLAGPIVYLGNPYQGAEGSLTVNAGATLSATTGIYLTQLGRLNLNGGTVTGPIIPQGGQLNWSSGTINQTNVSLGVNSQGAISFPTLRLEKKPGPQRR